MHHPILRSRIGKNHKAFTLVELMVVIVIIAILASYVGVNVIGHIVQTFPQGGYIFPVKGSDESAVEVPHDLMDDMVANLL